MKSITRAFLSFLCLLFVVSSQARAEDVKLVPDPHKTLDAVLKDFCRKHEAVGLAKAKDRKAKEGAEARATEKALIEAEEAYEKARDLLLPLLGHRLVVESADFLESMKEADEVTGKGYEAYAENIREYLDKGWLYIETSHRGESHNAETTWNNYIALNPDVLERVAHSLCLRSKPESIPLSKLSVLGYSPGFDQYLSPGTRRDSEDLWFAITASYAGTLYHEKIHAHQSLATKCTNEKEVQAHSATVQALGEMSFVLRKQFYDHEGTPEEALGLLRKMRILLAVRMAKLQEFKDQDYAKPYAKTLDDLVARISQDIKILDRAIDQNITDPIEFIFLDKRMRESAKIEKKEARRHSMRESRRTLDQERSSLAPARPVYTDEEVPVRFVGRDRAAGHVFDMWVANRTNETIDLEFGGLGTLMLTSNPDSQQMILSESVPIELGPGEEETFPVYGYCLDPTLAPPSEDDEYGPLCPERRTLPETVENYEQMVAIVRAGEELSEGGEYTTGIMPPRKYKETVIQRALWFERSQGTEEVFDKERLKKDLEEQLSQLEEERQPSPEQVEEVTETIWGDVDLTLKRGRGERS